MTTILVSYSVLMKLPSSGMLLLSGHVPTSVHVQIIAEENEEATILGGISVAAYLMRTL